MYLPHEPAGALVPFADLLNHQPPPGALIPDLGMQIAEFWPPAAHSVWVRCRAAISHVIVNDRQVARGRRHRILRHKCM